ncbi:2-C-methyl-D-erythritol 4-phosphate cytidylyltransferase [Fulvivirgaceae bacterium LMO-SS25]
MTKLIRSVIIVAGGSGSRMQSRTPKQFMLLLGKPLLMHTINCFTKAYNDIRIVLVLPSDHFETWKQLCKEFSFEVPLEIIAGGYTRFQSVRNGLAQIRNDELVAVHDGARPIVSTEVIRKAFKCAKANGSGVAAVPLKESIREGSQANSKARDRRNFYLIQTPQVFKSEILISAFLQEEKDTFTDEASVVESMGQSIMLSEGDYRNIKVTTAEDIIVAEALMMEKN